MNDTMVTTVSKVPEGLRIKRKGAGDPYYVAADLTQRILMSAGGTDLIEGVLRAGSGFTVQPPNELYRWTEVYFIISGELEFRMGSYSKPLGPHSHVISDHLAGRTRLEAKTDVKYIYFKTPKTDAKVGRETQTVESKYGSFRLLFSRSGKELVVGTVNKNRDIFFKPFEDDLFGTQELYYILEGSLKHSDAGCTFSLYKDDFALTDGLEDVVRFKATQPTSYLYFSGTPIFEDIHSLHNDLFELAVQVEEKDGYTAEHCSRIRSLSVRTGVQMELDDKSLLRVNNGAYLHDIGKVKVPLEILQKPGKLNGAEWEVVKQHPTFGLEILQSTRFSEAGIIVNQHHERMDGSGYPHGLRGSQIAIESYIVAVADAFDAMTTDRPYRKALSVEYALSEIDRFSNIHYPKQVVEAFKAANIYKKPGSVFDPDLA